MMLNSLIRSNLHGSTKKIVLELLKEEKTILQIAIKYKITSLTPFVTFA